MDKRIRRNENCIIGLPRCDFVFSSTRSAFIGRSCADSTFEMQVLQNLLTSRGIQVMEGNGKVMPGQNAFCQNLCSKVILSQFCVALLNNDERDGLETPNSGINMQYGLMLGFNKYVIPFQRASQQIPFSVAGLDTIRYTSEDFPRRAEEAIDIAIKQTTQATPTFVATDQVVETFLLTKRWLFPRLTSDAERNLFEMGRNVGFYLVTPFDGLQYAFFGNFTALRPEIILWRLRTLEEIVHDRFVASIPERERLGLLSLDAATRDAWSTFLKGLKSIILVTSDDDRSQLMRALESDPGKWSVEIYSMNEVAATLTGHAPMKAAAAHQF